MAPRIAVIGATPEADALRRALGPERLAEPAAAALWVDADHAFAPPLAERLDPHLTAERRAAAAVLRLARALWLPAPGDDWREVESPEAALAALEPAWRRVFLALGRDRIAPFARDRSRWYLTRIRGGADVAAPTPLGAVAAEPGPFDAAGEAALLAAARIEAIVARNVGGAGAYPKIAAARTLRLPVVLLRPPPPEPPACTSVAEACAWIATSLERLARNRG